MSFKIEISNDVNEKEWDSNLLKSPNSTGYQCYNWSKIYKNAYNSIPIFIMVKDDHGEIVGQLLTFIHNKYYWINAKPLIRTMGEKLGFGSILFWWYGPIIHNLAHGEEIISKILDALDKVAKKNNVLMIRGSSPPVENFSSGIFKKRGYFLKPWGTYIIDLNQKLDTIYKGLNKKTRYDIRKSEENSLQFEVATTRRTLSEYGKLKDEFKQKAGETIAVIPAFYDSHWKYLQKKGYEKLFLARNNGILIGGILTLAFNEGLIQHGVVNSFQKKWSGSFLTWSAIKWAIKNGYQKFDMGGFNTHPESEKEKAIDFYKSKWGGKKIVYHTFTKIESKTKFKIANVLINPQRLKKKLSKILINTE